MADTYICVKCNLTVGHKGKCDACKGTLKTLESLTDDDLIAMGIKQPEPGIVTYWANKEEK